MLLKSLSYYVATVLVSTLKPVHYVCKYCVVTVLVSILQTCPLCL